LSAAAASPLRSAERALRPSAGEALLAWAALVRADSEQVERLPRRPRLPDFYGPVAETFRADPRREDDPTLDCLRSLALPTETWLDLGAGGGRFTLAIALKAPRVYAIEPSEGMRAVLASAMAEHGVTNIDVFPERWPGPSEAPVADVGFMSHVSYDIADICVVSGLAPVAKNNRGAAFDQGTDKFWNHGGVDRSRVLPGAKDIEIS